LRGMPTKTPKECGGFSREITTPGQFKISRPHLSFQGGICQDIRIIDASLKQLSAKIRPFLVWIEGLNTFQEPDRVIFMEVVRTRTLQRIHQSIDALLRKHCSQTFELCSPQSWHPHVTLACEDLSPSSFRKAKKDLENYRPRYKLKLHNICLVKWYQKDRIRIYKKYLLN
jgi:2'-5' RNA ligase